MKLRIIGVVALLGIFLSSCAIKKGAYKKVDKAAVISFSSSDKVKNNSSIQARLLTEARDLDTTLEDVANKVKTRFYELTPKLTSKLIDEDEVIESDKFDDYIETLDQELSNWEKLNTMGVDFVTPEGYPFIRPHRKDPMTRAFDYLPSEVDAVLVVQSYYGFEEGGTVSVGGLSSAGLSKQKVRCTLVFSMINREGKRVMQYTVTELSNGKLGNKSEEGSLDELVNEALAKCMSTANKKFRKKL